MIPTKQQVKILWDKYNLSNRKRIHSDMVKYTALFLAEYLMREKPTIKLDKKLLEVAALLHDIDKGIPKLKNEIHPDAAVRVLSESGMEEVGRLVKTHALHLILDPSTAPGSWEEKILYLSDKMVKDDIIGVDERFRLWHEEQMPDPVKQILDQTYPLVKQLELEICQLIRTTPDQLVKNIKSQYTKADIVNLSLRNGGI